MRILNNDFKIVVLLKIVAYNLQLRSPKLRLKTCCLNFSPRFLWFNS